MAPSPTEIDWSALSRESLEVVAHISMRESAGYNLDEIARLCERERDSFRYLPVPVDRPIRKAWVSARLRDLRDDIERSGAAS